MICRQFIAGWADTWAEVQPEVTYDPEAVTAYFDALGQAEWDRLERTLGDRVSLALHARVIERFIPRGSRVLDIGAGPGRFTEVLHRLGCRIVVADLSSEQLALNRQAANNRGFAPSVESWHLLDICDLSSLAAESFDAVVAFGGPLSYVFDQRDRALEECRRVLQPGGLLCLSVMSLWGTMHRYLPGVLSIPMTTNRTIMATGDLTKDTAHGSRHYCHMFRSEELRSFLDRPGLDLLWISAANALSTGHDSSPVLDSTLWEALLELEEAACAQPGYLDAGTHLIAVARQAHRPPNPALQPTPQSRRG